MHNRCPTSISRIFVRHCINWGHLFSVSHLSLNHNANDKDRITNYHNFEGKKYKPSHMRDYNYIL